MEVRHCDVREAERRLEGHYRDNFGAYVKSKTFRTKDNAEWWVQALGADIALSELRSDGIRAALRAYMARPATRKMRDGKAPTLDAERAAPPRTGASRTARRCGSSPRTTASVCPVPSTTLSAA
jgi:hypothetical protein